ncbi:hypothetical protein EGY25_03325 [Brevundimonas intermedia]|uniref:Uncharacterized protein n=1 Tax=Brevundimonas intermedia TaxID=74315 RepID=A0A4Y9RZB1_9CAUL|nr:hypothetical protein [Brevundimonas intermedia]TFW14243.1 hypothetical protein EGY25_03325 [Brevundimonas intermedia]
MGLFEQAFRETEVRPLRGVLAEIGQVLDRVRNPEDNLEEGEALTAIARLTREARGDVYQKPWG